MKSILKSFRTILKPIGTLLALLQRVILFTLVYLFAGPIAAVRASLKRTRKNPETFWIPKHPSTPQDFLRQY